MTVSDLTQGASYSFTVAGIDTEGRVGGDSVLAQVITLDSKLIHVYSCYKWKTSINISPAQISNTANKSMNVYKK